ncbi:MAG: M24 family metallopeptidase [Desulfohalobiaceae bacterium]
MPGTTPAFHSRREELRRKLHGQGLDALLVSHAANRFYLSGFELHDPQCNESAGMLLVTASGRDWLLTDPRYLEAARRVWPKERVFVYTGKKHQQIADFLQGLSPGTLGFEARSMSFDLHKDLADKLDLAPTRNLVEELRTIKDPLEIEALAASCALNHRVLEQIEAGLAPGGTEEELAWTIEKAFREAGASEMSFTSIVAVGPNAALPHAIPGQDRITPQSPVLVDTGARYQGYCSDQTRTFWVGDRPTDVFLRTRELVQKAQERAIRAIRPGMAVKDLHAVAYDFFAGQGEAAHFTHALGHGIGLETHEPPSLSPFSPDVLKPGMVITIEPGLYYPEWGGVRWEYMVLVTQDGAEVL